VRAAQKFGIVERVTYRPSSATKIVHISSGMDSVLRDVTYAVVDGRRSPDNVLRTDLPIEEKREVLDLAAELTQYRFLSRKLDEERYKKQFLDILASRSTLGTPAADPYPIATPTPPDQGHLSGRIRTGGGYRTGTWFGEAEWRAAYHDITDFDEGYVRGAQINFMDVSVRYYFDDETWHLHRLDVINILSLSPWNGIFKPISWKVNAGVEDMMLSDGKDHPVLELNAGGGLTGGLGTEGLVYLIAEADANASDRLEKGYALGFGGIAGLMMNVARNWKVNLWAQGLFYRIGDPHQRLTASLQQTFRFTTNTCLSLDATREQAFDNYKTDIVVRGNWYY
jgi:hypothetical protein